jgi:hypothetical protein
MKYIITELQYSLLEDDMDFDPCYEKSIKFYQSKEGRELLDLLRKQIEGSATTPNYKLSKEERKRAKYLLRLSPKC